MTIFGHVLTEVSAKLPTEIKAIINFNWTCADCKCQYYLLFHVRITKF